MFAAFDAPGRFRRGNLHGHSTASDGALAPSEVCARYRAAGYDFICLSDHFLARFGHPVTDTRDFREGGFTTLLGAELHAPQTAQGALWHILAVGLPLDFAPPGASETGPDIAARAAAAGAFVALAHPHWSHLSVEDGLSVPSAHAVEVYNHKSAIEVDRGEGLAHLDALLHAGRRLGAIACDDSHWHNEDAFGGWVWVKAREATPDALLAGLRDGAYYASQGPELHGVARDGDWVEVACTPVASIILAGPGQWRQRVLGQGLTSARLPLEAETGGWRRLIVRDALGRRAWTNPVWLA